MNEKLYSRRWGVLAALFLALFGLQFSFIVPGGCALPLMQRYGIDPTLFSMVMSVPYFCGILFGILAGTMADRIGVTKVMIAGFAIAFVGVIWRSLSGDNYLMLFLSSFVMGFATAALNANSAKIIRAWFPGKSANVAFGVYVCAASFGAAVALQFGARTDVQICWNLSIVLIAIAIVCWFLLYREHPEGIPVQEPISRHLGVALKNKSVWGISLFAFFFMGATVIGTSFMVAGLQVVYGTQGADAANAANISTFNTVIVCLSCIFLPALVAKFKHLRGISWVLLLGTGIFYALGLQVPFANGVLPAIMLGLGGLFVGPIMSMTKTLPALLPDIDPKYMGAIGGVQSTFQNIGMFLVSSYIISPICMAIDPLAGPTYYRDVFIGLLVCCIIAGVCMYLYPNLRTNIEDMLADKASDAVPEDKS